MTEIFVYFPTIEAVGVWAYFTVHWMAIQKQCVGGIFAEWDTTACLL